MNPLKDTKQGLKKKNYYRFSHSARTVSVKCNKTTFLITFAAGLLHWSPLVCTSVHKTHVKLMLQSTYIF